VREALGLTILSVVVRRVDKVSMLERHGGILVSADEAAAKQIEMLWDEAWNRHDSESACVLAL